MKFDVAAEKEAAVVGDIKQNNVSIDTNNINFIVTILSTNLYSKPIESFIRETVSNAWDSHVEAGNTDPVILELGKDTEGKYFCRVQDFGVGLSPERFNDVYRNIGSSTKRGDNNQIGGFGIGRFAALAYSDVVHITSVHEGIKYKYMMYKDGNTISIDLLHQQECDERNGLEVLVELREPGGEYEAAKFYEAIKKQLVYFENLYFVNSTDSKSIPKDEFNSFHIKKYRDFLVNDLDSTSRTIDLVLGKVRYPLRLDSLSKSYPKYVQNYPISLIFNIGDLEVTPNREEILYSQKNIDKIQEALDNSIEEIDVIFDSYSNKNFDKVSEYIEALQHSHQAPLLTVNGVNTVYIKIDSNELKITLKGNRYPKDNFIKLYSHIMGNSLIPVPYIIEYGKIVYRTKNISLNTIKENFDKVYIGDIGSMNNMSKSYIRDTFSSSHYFIFSNRNINYFIKKYIESERTYGKKGNYNGVTYDYKTVKVILESVLPNIGKIRKFSDSSVPKSYIDRVKADNKAKRALMKNAGIDWSQNVNMFNLRMSNSGTGVTTTNEAISLANIKKKYTKLTVYADKDDEKIRTFFSILMNSHQANFVEVAPTRQKLLKGFQNFVKIEDFMSVKYKLIRQIATAKLIEEEIPHLPKLLAMQSSLGKISTRLQNVVVELGNYNKKYISNKNSVDEKKLIQEIYELCQEKNYFDETIRGVLNQNLVMLKNAQALLLFDENTSGYNKGIPNERINLVVDYILARKLFRPDVQAVIKLKKETILNITKDESN